MVAIDCNREMARQQLIGDLQVILAGALCKGFSRQDIHSLVDLICDYYEHPET